MLNSLRQLQERVARIERDLSKIPSRFSRGGNGARLSKQVQIIALANDYLTVTDLDSEGVPTDTTIVAAKPLELRHTVNAVNNATSWVTTDTNTADVTVGGKVYVHHVANYGFAAGQIITIHRHAHTGLIVSDEPVVWEVLPGQRWWAGELEEKSA